MRSPDDIQKFCQLALKSIMKDAECSSLEDVCCVLVKMMSICSVGIAEHYGKDQALLCLCDTIKHVHGIPLKAN